MVVVVVAATMAQQLSTAGRQDSRRTATAN